MDPRTLVRSILDFWHLADEGELVERVLPVLVQLTGARQAYVEVQSAAGDPLWWRAAGCDDDVALNELRVRTSRGIVQAALDAVNVVVTTSAVLDPAFRERDSVRGYQIEAVICAPILHNDLPIGVVYVQNRGQGGPFEPEDVEMVRALAAMLAPAVDQIRRMNARDYTREVRQTFACGAFIGRSRALAEVLQQASMVAALDVDVLIGGPTGTGKSMLAAAIHHGSPRASGPFHAVTCAAIPATLFEREMYGHVPEAFTGARSAQQGHVDRAEGGTLFLDEVDTLPPQAQAALLELLQTHKYFPVGGGVKQADIRIISASNQDLEELVRLGQFRADLYYRLNAMPIRMPPLAERLDDLPLLVEGLLERVARRHHGRLPRCRATSGLLRETECRHWPGNIRQLENVLVAAVIRCSAEGGTDLTARHAFPELAPYKATEPQTYQAATREFQARLILRTLEATAWNVTEAAERLDVDRRHLHALIRRFDLTRQRSPRADDPAEQEH